MQPLCVDLDGSLLATDLLHESVLLAVKRRPWVLGSCALWLVRGRAHLKERLSVCANPEVSRLPYRDEVVAFLKEERAKGRTIVLTTASHATLARQVADHLGLFDEVIATGEGRNLKGRAKAEELVRRYGERGFDYLGDSAADMPVWTAADRSFVVDRSGTLANAVRRKAKVERVFRGQGRIDATKAAIRALRPHQWAKNVLLLVPLAAMHRLADPVLLAMAFLGFLAFCATASSAYLLNDLLDLEADRAHPRKRSRPFASGRLSIPAGVAMLAGTLVVAVALAWEMPPWFQVSLGAYLALTLAYSFGLKRIAMVDVVSLAALYTMRIVAGGFAVSAPASFWLLALSMFLFFSLAMVKRFAEITALAGEAMHTTPGRGYIHADEAVLLAMGGGSGLMSVLVLALYMNGETVTTLYSHPAFLWLLCPLLLYWIARIWLIAARGRMDDDPVLFALRDRTSWLAAAAGAVVAWLAT